MYKLYGVIINAPSQTQAQSILLLLLLQLLLDALMFFSFSRDLTIRQYKKKISGESAAQQGDSSIISLIKQKYTVPQLRSPKGKTMFLPSSFLYQPGSSERSLRGHHPPHPQRSQRKTDFSYLLFPSDCGSSLVPLYKTKKKYIFWFCTGDQKHGDRLPTALLFIILGKAMPSSLELTYS